MENIQFLIQAKSNEPTKTKKHYNDFSETLQTLEQQIFPQWCCTPFDEELFPLSKTSVCIKSFANHWETNLLTQATSNKLETQNNNQFPEILRTAPEPPNPFRSWCSQLFHVILWKHGFPKLKPMLFIKTYEKGRSHFLIQAKSNKPKTQ